MTSEDVLSDSEKRIKICITCIPAKCATISRLLYLKYVILYSVLKDILGLLKRMRWCLYCNLTVIYIYTHVNNCSIAKATRNVEDWLLLLLFYFLNPLITAAPLKGIVLSV